jgi:hypothetical protein
VECANDRFKVHGLCSFGVVDDAMGLSRPVSGAVFLARMSILRRLGFVLFGAACVGLAFLVWSLPSSGTACGRGGCVGWGGIGLMAFLIGAALVVRAFRRE